MRIHVSFKVKDLGASTRFYSRLFGSEPALRKDDYAKWSLNDPRTNFSIVKSAGEGGLHHLGIEAESPEELQALRARARNTGCRFQDEGETVCCYARSDKAWLTDMEGVQWEVFYTHHQVEDAPSAARMAVRAPGEIPCCEPGCCDGKESVPGEAARGASSPEACCQPECCSSDRVIVARA